MYHPRLWRFQLRGVHWIGLGRYERRWSCESRVGQPDNDVALFLYIVFMIVVGRLDHKF